jgi:hypothetical protein
MRGTHALSPTPTEGSDLAPNATSGGTDSPGAVPTNTTVAKINVSQLKAKVEAQFTALVNGINTVLASVTTFELATATIAKKDLVDKFSSRIAAAEKSKAARLALHTAVAEETKLAAEVAPYRRDMRAFLVSRFGNGSPTLQVFGFTPAKATQKSATAKAQGVAKAKATRQALGTKGKKQRKTAAKALATAPAQTPVAAPSPTPAASAASVSKPGAVS